MTCVCGEAGPYLLPAGGAGADGGAGTVKEPVAAG